MTALSFPIATVVGQVYSANNKSWTWDGVAWIPESLNWKADSISAESPITYDSSTATIGLDPVDGGTA